MTCTTETAAVKAPAVPDAPSLADADYPVETPDFPEAREDPEQSAELELQLDA
jgi:hypothetical protein